MGGGETRPSFDVFVEIACTFLGRFLLGGSNAKKWDDHQKKFFINSFVEDLSPFKEEHQDL